MNGAPLDRLDTCGCCEAAPTKTPVLSNEPSLPALAFRIGTHASFLRRMVARIPAHLPPPDGPTLAALRTRASDDATIALLDAWATAADVLTFYQERVANEGFLRTATERRSVLELARAIGYELRPGVAATTHLAFTVEDAPGAPGTAKVEQGTQVLSIPGQNQLPQPFETNELVAQAAWNELRPRLTQPQRLALANDVLFLADDQGQPLRTDSGGNPVKLDRLYFAGTDLRLSEGELVLVVLEPDAGSTAPKTAARVIRSVEVETERKRTRVDIDEPAPPLPEQPPAKQPGKLKLEALRLDADNVTDRILGRSWSESQLGVFFQVYQWDPAEVLAFVQAPRVPPTPDPVFGVFTFRDRLGFFGNSAPFSRAVTPKPPTPKGPYPNDWDTAKGWEIWKDPQSNTAWSGVSAYLERLVPKLVENGWVVIEDPAIGRTAYRLAAPITEQSAIGFATTARVTGMTLVAPDGGAPETSQAFKVRSSTAHVRSERLELIDLPIEDPVGDDAHTTTKLVLDGLVLGLAIGQPIALSGERNDLAGAVVHEIAVVADIVHNGGLTMLTFAEPLENVYVRSTVTLNANVAAATHGGTVASELLGTGDGAQPNQSFTLAKPPLTYVSAPRASGAASTLELRVNGVLWEEVETLFGLTPRSESYVVRHSDDGATTITVGDGVMGARIATGAEVVARYRSGIGSPGLVDADALTLLQKRPLGIRGVTNPVKAANAADPEALDAARTNAPLTVLTLDRIVSLRDVEDFTRAFAGIGKAQATPLWRGEDRVIHVTIAGEKGAEIAEASPLHGNLLDAIEAARDPGRPILLGSFQKLYFDVAAEVLVDPRYVAATVRDAARTALLAAFSFERRDFGRPVSSAEIVTVIQEVEGVVACNILDLEVLLDDGSHTPVATPGGAILPVDRARVDPQSGEILLAELLLVDPAGITFTEMSP